jgi:ABC-2 type transport system ATP-binding protein
VAQIDPRGAELLERFGLSGAADRPVRTYSGGMRRRLDLAASLVHRPPVLFLDEPTTGLDIQGRSELWDMIRELVSDGTTVVLTTQYLEEADRLAERVAVVDDGRVIANDTPTALKSQLGSTVTELGLPTVEDAERAHVLLTGRYDAGVEREHSTIRLTSHDGARVLVDVLRSLTAEGMEPVSLVVRQPSLDDVFLTLTGHHAEEKAEDRPETEPAA